MMRERQTLLTGKAVEGVVHLRPPQWTDFEMWSELRQKNAEYLRPWEPSGSGVDRTRSAYRQRLSRYKTLRHQDRAHPFYIFREDELVGACNITHIERGSAQSAKLGYWIGESYTGRGFAQASVGAVTKFCFSELGLHRVEAAVQSDNFASIRVLQASSYSFEGKARRSLKINGAWRDHDIYARLSED